MAKALRGLPTLLVGMLLLAVLFTAYTAQSSLATHEPAQKTAAAGSDIDTIPQNQKHVILEDTIRVSSTQDAIITVSSECSILTALKTGDSEEQIDPDPTVDGDEYVQSSASRTGQVEIWVEIDGQRVPVQYSDLGNKEEPVGSDGEVVFCNRTYQRTMQDRAIEEDPDEGEGEGELDVERDYIRTRSANAFTWLAKDLGLNYDNLADRNNVVTVKVWAQYTYDADDPETTTDEDGNPIVETTCDDIDEPGTERTCSEAFVGSRTLVIEPTNVAIHEFVQPDDGEGE